MDQYYRIAGLTVKMDAFGITRDLAQPYGIDSCSQADITIEADLREMKALYPHVADGGILLCSWSFPLLMIDVFESLVMQCP